MLWGDRGHCPKCGRFCGDIVGTIKPDCGLVRVEGQCRTHGTVDLSKQDWDYEDFDGEQERVGNARPHAEARSADSVQADVGQEVGP
jgi:hypothetical protein